MKLKYLGTAAAEGMPALFCSCENCEKARRLGGKNIRSRSQTMVNDDLIIDYPPDAYAHSVRFGIDLTKIRYLLVTHRHEDHWFPPDLRYTKPGFSHPAKDWQGMQIFGSEDIRDDVEELQKADVRGIGYTQIEPFNPFRAGKYTVTALKAWHGTDHPYNYIISDGEKTILYDHDSDLFTEETYAYLKKAGVRFDLVSMDCTNGGLENVNYRGHMGLESNPVCRQMLLDIGAADEKTVFVVNHFSHNGTFSCHEDMEPKAAALGFIAAYDGLEIEI